MIAKRTVVLAVVVMTFVFFDAASPFAQTYPSRPVKLVVPYPPGGPTDTLARVLSEQIGRAHGATFVIENRPGAGGVVGTELVSRAARDGATLLINPNSFVVDAHLRKVNHNPLTSFEPICHLVNSPMVFVVNSASPYRTLADFVGTARARPGELTVAGGGTGTRVLVEMFKRGTDVEITYVPFPGAAPGITALLGGHVASQWLDYAPAAEQLKGGRLRALATPSGTRIPPLPDVPTIAESGYKDFVADDWFGLCAPAGVPPQTVSRLADWFTAALHAPEVATKLAALGQFPAAICGAEFAGYLQREYDRYGRIIREANIKAE